MKKTKQTKVRCKRKIHCLKGYTVAFWIDKITWMHYFFITFIALFIIIKEKEQKKINSSFRMLM